MALFVIYSDLADYEWKETFDHLITLYKNEVYVISSDISSVKARLLLGGFYTTQCLEVKEESCDLKHIDEAKKLTGFSGEEIIVVAPVLAGLDVVPENCKKILINGEKTHFADLKKLCKPLKHSNSPEFKQVSDLLLEIERDLKDSWPITPKENLEAQKSFLSRVLTFADKSPDATMEECLLVVKKQFESKGDLTDVTTMPANVALLKWGIFRAVLMFNTPTGDLLKLVEERKADREEKERSARAEIRAREIGRSIRDQVAAEAKKEEAARQARIAQSARLSSRPAGYGTFE